MNQIRLHGRIVKSKEGLNEGVLNSHIALLLRQLIYECRGSGRDAPRTRAG